MLMSIEYTLQCLIYLLVTNNPIQHGMASHAPIFCMWHKNAKDPCHPRYRQRLAVIRTDTQVFSFPLERPNLPLDRVEDPHHGPLAPPVSCHRNSL